MQFYVLPELSSSGRYENTVTAIGFLSRYVFANPATSQDAKTIARVIFNIITKYAYLPATKFRARDEIFTSQMTKEVAGSRKEKFSEFYTTACHNKARTDNWKTRMNTRLTG